MGKQRERYEAFFERRRGPRDRQIEGALLKVVDAYDAAEESGHLSDAGLQLILAGAKSPRTMLWGNVCDLLKHLADRWRTAAEGILALSKDPKAHVRFTALCSLGTGTPPDIADAVLKAGLKDKSAKVRWKAADRAEWLKKSHLLPDLVAALAVEKNAKTRGVIESHLVLLRDGYELKRDPDGTVHLWVRTSRGYTGHSVSPEELEQKGLEAIVKEVARE